MWETVKLGDVCDFEGGSQPPKKEFVYEEQDGYVRFIQIRDFKSDKNLTYIPIAKKNRLCVDEDILIGRYGASVGQIHRGLAGAYNVALMKTIPNADRLSKGWLYAYLNSSLFQKPLLEVSKRSAQNGFSKDEISDFNLPLPPLSEQQRIVDKLDAAFAEIDLAIELASQQLSLFDDLAYRLTEALTHSENHQTRRLSDLTEIQPPKKLSRDKLSDSDDVTFMGMDRLGIEQKYSTSDEVKTLSDAYKSYQYFEENDLLLAKITPCFENGKLSIANQLVNGVGFGSSEFVVIRTGSELITDYAYYSLLCRQFRREGEKNMSGAVGHKRVTKDYIANYVLSIPTVEEQIKITKKLDDVWKHREIGQKSVSDKIISLAALKSAILAQELQSEAL